MAQAKERWPSFLCPEEDIDWSTPPVPPSCPKLTAVDDIISLHLTLTPLEVQTDEDRIWCSTQMDVMHLPKGMTIRIYELPALARRGYTVDDSVALRIDGPLIVPLKRTRDDASPLGQLKGVQVWFMKN